jgi:hypothetical protein
VVLQVCTAPEWYRTRDRDGNSGCRSMAPARCTCTALHRPLHSAACHPVSGLCGICKPCVTHADTVSACSADIACGRLLRGEVLESRTPRNTTANSWPCSGIRLQPTAAQLTRALACAACRPTPPPPLGKHTCAHSTCIQAKAHQGNCTHAAQVLNLDPVQTEQLPQGRQLPMGCPHAGAECAAKPQSWSSHPKVPSDPGSSACATVRTTHGQPAPPHRPRQGPWRNHWIVPGCAG